MKRIHQLNQHRACKAGQNSDCETATSDDRVTCPDCRVLMTLDPDAPDAPIGFLPREGVTYGCGRAECGDCYEVER